MSPIVSSTAISTSITPPERLEAVQKAKDSFNHNVQAVHDDEMATGADAALTKHLTFLMYRAKKHGADNTETEDSSIRMELSLTCDAMESLFRASSNVVGVSFQRMGKELMQLLVIILNEEVRQRQGVATAAVAATTVDDALLVMGQPKEDDTSTNDGKCPSTPRLNEEEKPSAAASSSDETFRTNTIPPAAAAAAIIADTNTAEGDLMLRKATKLLGHFARVGEATEPMAHFPGLLGSLVNLIALRPYHYTPWEARLSALWTLANLACNSENMRMMACTPGLLCALVEVASRSLHPTDSLEKTMETLRSRSIASRAILNLSWSPENKVLLSEHAALIDLLAQLIVLRSVSLSLNKSTTVQDILDTTRRHAAGALRNLAAAPRRIKIGLCNYKSGHLLDVLTDAALNDPDVPVKDRAFATIHNLAINDTAQTIVSHPALVLALKDVLLSTDEVDCEDHRDGTPKQHAAATLLVLERTITPGMDSYENLRDLLDAIPPITNDAAVTCDDREASAQTASV